MEALQENVPIMPLPLDAIEERLTRPDHRGLGTGGGHLKQSPVDARPVLICFPKGILAKRQRAGVGAINPLQKVTRGPSDSTSSFSMETVLVPEPAWSQLRFSDLVPFSGSRIYVTTRSPEGVETTRGVRGPPAEKEA